MGNRSMDAKRIKYIRASKARPRTLRMNYGYMKETSTVNERSKVPEEWLPLFDYRTRAMVSSAEDFLSTLFPSANQESNQRKQALFLSRRREADTILYTVVFDSKYIKTVLISNLALTCFHFEEYHTVPKLLKTSFSYNNRERALAHFESNSIRWKKAIQIPDVEPAP